MTSPILMPGDPGYEKWHAEYRQRKINERLSALSLFLIVFLLGCFVWFIADQKLWFPQWYSISTGYVVAGLILFVYAMIKDYVGLREIARDGKWGRFIAYLSLTIVFWPLVMIFIIIFD